MFLIIFLSVYRYFDRVNCVDILRIKGLYGFFKVRFTVKKLLKISRDLFDFYVLLELKVVYICFRMILLFLKGGY